TAGDVTMRYGEVGRQELLRTSDEVVVTATRVALTVSRPSRSGHGEPEVGQQRRADVGADEHEDRRDRDLPRRLGQVHEAVCDAHAGEGEDRGGQRQEIDGTDRVHEAAPAQAAGE